MVKTIVAFILSFGILAGFISDNEKIQQNDFEEIVELALENNVEIKSWMALSRGKVGQATDLNDLNKQIADFMMNHDTYSWKKILEEENSHYVWLGKKENDNGIMESIKLKAYKSGETYKIAITTEVKGTQISDNQVEWVREKMKDDNTFYTVSGVIGSTDIQLNQVAEKMIKDAQGKTVEQLREKSFVSVSAYSDTIETELMTAKREKMNLQIGLRANEESNKIDVTIGTPIITTEY